MHGREASRADWLSGHVNAVSPGTFHTLGRLEIEDGTCALHARPKETSMNVRFITLIAGMLASSVVLPANSADRSSTAATGKPDDNACTWFRSIDDWQRLDDRNLIVWGPNKAAFHVELSMPLFDLGSADSIAFIDNNRDGQLCGFGMDQVVVPHAPIFESATILGMTLA